MGRPHPPNQKMKERPPERVLPKQNTSIIAGICVCQLTVVLSIVSFMYLTVTIYRPSYVEFYSGFEHEPVTCETLDTVMNNSCNWASCGEWCLTKTSGFCPQIYVTVRRNSTDIILENCSRLSTNSCPQANVETFKKFNCNNGSECNALTGLFNCSLGHCANMSDQLMCDYKADGITIDSEKDNNKLTGFFECHRSRCTKIKKPFHCERKFCPKITTVGVNIFLMYEDSVYSGDCVRALAKTATNGTSIGYDVPLTEIWTENKTGGYLLASCRKLEKSDSTLMATDCTNGTVLPESQMPTPYVNFTTFWSVFEKSTRPLDPEQRFVPMQGNITIYPKSRLFINRGGCVNTLKGECKEFLKTHGKDGKDHTAIARFPCYYNKEDSDFVITRFDLEKTRRELLVALIVPSVLFAISFTTLMVVTRSVKVGDDAILRCRLCGSDEKTLEKDSETVALKADKTADNGEAGTL